MTCNVTYRRELANGRNARRCLFKSHAAAKIENVLDGKNNLNVRRVLADLIAAQNDCKYWARFEKCTISI